MSTGNGQQRCGRSLGKGPFYDTCGGHCLVALLCLHASVPDLSEDDTCPWSPCADSPDEGSEESSLSNGTMLRCSRISPELGQTMLETNQILRTQIARLERERQEVKIHNDVMAMASFETEIRETDGLMYTGLD